MSFVILTGAYVNFGDFLIKDRAIKLLRKFHPNTKLVEHKRDNNLSPILKICNSAKAIILCGGPGYWQNIYPNIFPLTKNLDDIKVPVIPFGFGWRAGGFGDIKYEKTFSFAPSSMKLLHKIHDNIKYSSCREVIIQRILKRHGFNNVLMTGCPVWYDLDKLDAKFQPMENPARIVFSLPGNRDESFKPQIKAIYDIIGKAFPKAEIICAVHRDLKHRKAFINSLFGAGVRHIEGGLQKGLELYESCDLHIGYRVHGHLLALSMRKPSILLEIDGRGRGTNESLGMQGIWAIKRGKKGNVANSTAPEELAALIKREKESKFASYIGLEKTFEKHYNTMKKFLESLL